MMSDGPGEFATLLRAFRERMGLSCNETARAVGVDPSYISRLERGEREPPRRRVVEGLALALQLGPDDEDALIVSAGYSPDHYPRMRARLERLEQERGALLALLSETPAEIVGAEVGWCLCTASVRAYARQGAK